MLQVSRGQALEDLTEVGAPVRRWPEHLCLPLVCAEVLLLDGVLGELGELSTGGKGQHFSPRLTIPSCILILRLLSGFLDGEMLGEPEI